MTYAASSSRYLENEILSRPPEWLVPLLYEHLLIALRRAEAQIAARDIEGKAASLERASTIVAELLASLDHEKGGEIAGQLSSLYAYFAGEIIDIGRTMNQLSLQRVIAMVADLHSAWEEAAEQVAPRKRPGSRTLTSHA